MRRTGEFESSYHIFNTFIKLRDWWTTIQSPSFFTNHHVASPWHPFSFFLKTLAKVMFRHASEDVLTPTSCSFTGNRWAVAQEPVMPADSIPVKGWSEDVSTPQPMTGWSNPQCWYRRWELLTPCIRKSEAVGRCQSALHPAEAGKRLVAHQNVQKDVASVWLTPRWPLYPLHEATRAGMSPLLTHTNTLH